MTQLQLKNGFSLLSGQPEAGHQLCFGFIFVADNRDNFIDVQIGHQQAFKNMQTRQDLIQPVLQAPGDGGATEAEPLRQHFAQALHARAAVIADDVDIHPIGFLQIRAGKQVGHQPFLIHTIGAWNDHQPGRVLMVGFVAQVRDHGQLFGLHLLGDLLQNPVSRDLMRQVGHHDFPALVDPARPHP